MSILNDALDQLSGQVLDGETVFKLYDTYGFPADLTNDVARERGFSIDEAGFEQAMEEQRQRAREAGQFGTDYNSLIKSATNTDSAVTRRVVAKVWYAKCSWRARKFLRCQPVIKPSSY